MPEFTLFQAILHTGSETAEQIQTKTPELSESEVENWAKVYSLMDGQVALVIPSFLSKNEYILIGLRDRERDREVHYLIEQDPEIGCYINQREEFDRDYNNGEYAPDGNFCLSENQVEIIEEMEE